MACLLVPATEAVITTVATKVIKKKEKKAEIEGVKIDPGKIPFSKKLSWLNKLLWGGSVLLALEHAWHGEITPWFPFLTAAADPQDRAAMLREIATTGFMMAVCTTLLWCGMLAVCHLIEKKDADDTAEARS